MKITLQPNEINDVSALALVAGLDLTDLDMTIEYLSGGTKGQKIFLANTSVVPTLLSSENGQGILVCDDSAKSVRSTLAVAGNSIYAWFKSTNVEPITVLVG